MNHWEPPTDPYYTGSVGPGVNPRPRDQKRRRRHPLVNGAIAFVLVLGVGAVLAFVIVKASPNGGTLAQPGASALPSATAPAQAPTSTSEPTPVANPPDPVSPGVPTSIAVYRGQTTIIPTTTIDGAYTPSGSTVDPPGNDPVWISVSSQVGTGMKTAVIAGHAQSGNANMPFTALGNVQVGDTIEVKVPAGTLTFVVDDAGTPNKGMMGFAAKDNTLEVISCAVIGGGPVTKNVVDSAHLVSSKAA